MKTGKLIDKMDRLLGAERREQLERLDELHKLLNKLRKRRDALKDELKTAKDNEAKQSIRDDIEVLKLHRKKGLALLKELG